MGRVEDIEPVAAPPWENRLRDYLARAGLRVTHQRRAIARAFFESEGHPNIDELYTRIRAQHPRIGQATVYRTLKLLVESGLAEQSRFGDGSTRYEAHHAGEHHDHLICLDCGYVLEFHNEQLEELQDQIAAEHDFDVTEHKLVLYANCKRTPCPRRDEARAVLPTKPHA